MLAIFFNILPIFLIILLGNVLKRTILTASEFWRGLEKLAYFVLLPSLLFRYISKANLGSGQSLKVVLALILATTIVSGLLILYQRKQNIDPKIFTSLFQGGTRYNSYIFIALGDSMYGEEGLGIVAVISAYMIIFTSITSVLAFAYYIPDDDGEKKEVTLASMLRGFATNPLIIASFLGALFNFSGFNLGFTLDRFLHSISEASLAIGVLNVGAGLKFSFDAKKYRVILESCITKLIILPLVTIPFIYIFKISGLVKSVGILYSCLPCAGSSYILSRQLGGDPDSMAAIISSTIIMSVLTLAIILPLF